jgi:ATP-binding cassette subfamily B protein
VDAQTEHEIISNLRPYLSGKICVIVSHRLAPLAHAHRIVVLENGRVAEKGSHQELLAQGGLYAAIHEHQSLEEECR